MYLIHLFQKIRCPAMDFFGEQLDFFDNIKFFLLLITLLTLTVNWRTAFKVFYLLMLGYFLNSILKNAFELPRPFHLDPALGLIHVQGYGFPSGAAQSAMTLAGILLLECKNRWKWLVAVSYLLLISFSRIYLGVHFPVDIVGGWMAALAMLSLYVWIFPRIEQKLEKLKPIKNYLLNCLFLSSILVLSAFKQVSICFLALGLSSGIFISILRKQIIPPQLHMKEFLSRSLIGLAGTFTLYFLGNRFAFQPWQLHAALLYFAIGIWISLAAYSVCYKISLSLHHES